MAAESNEGTLEDVECGLEMPGAASDNAGGREVLKINRDAVESVLRAILNDVYEEQRVIGNQRKLEANRLILLQNELDETLRTIQNERRKLMALQQDQTFTAKQIKDALQIDTKHFEAQLKINQPELYSYCTQLANARQCVLAINSIRECKRQIQLAESLIANRYANFLSDKTGSGSTIETVSGSLMGQSSALVEICTQYQASLGTLTSPISLSTSADNRVTLVRPYHMRSNVGTGTGSVRDRSKPRKLCIVKADSSSGQQSSWRTSGNTVALQSANNRRQGSNDVNFRYDDTSNSSSDVVRIEIRDRDSCPSWLPALRDVKPGTTASLLPTLINVTGTKPSTRDSRKR